MLKEFFNQAAQIKQMSERIRELEGQVLALSHQTTPVIIGGRRQGKSTVLRDYQQRFLDDHFSC